MLSHDPEYLNWPGFSFRKHFHWRQNASMLRLNLAVGFLGGFLLLYQNSSGSVIVGCFVVADIGDSAVLGLDREWTRGAERSAGDAAESG